MSSKAAWIRQLAVEKILRKAGGLDGGQTFHPSREVFERQAEAVAKLKKLVESGDYTAAQIGVFAQEIGHGGVRNFVVDTYAGFALNNAPECNPEVFTNHAPEAVPQTPYAVPYGRSGAVASQAISQQSSGSTKDPGTLNHLYELLLEDRPCWLYFDLEYSKITNPKLDPTVAMNAFRETLASFFEGALGTRLDLSGLLELESSTPEKFSKHILVQRFYTREGDSDPECLAFANNAQAGLLVSEFVAYARARRDVKGSVSQHLFVQAPHSEKQPNNSLREVTLVDESVYSRNRCFRLLFHKKFGKQAALKLSQASISAAFNNRREYPPLQLLRTMASYVPDDTPIFHHAMVPRDTGHKLCKGVRVFDGASGDSLRGRQAGSINGCKVDPVLHNGLLQFLVDTWDSVRKHNECGLSEGRPTTVQSAVKMTEQFLCVTLANNRFCFCKNSSHMSNSVYMVVDHTRKVFHQKCHDSDCRHFRSPEFAIPDWLLETEEEDAALLEALAATVPNDLSLGGDGARCALLETEEEPISFNTSPPLPTPFVDKNSAANQEEAQPLDQGLPVFGQTSCVTDANDPAKQYDKNNEAAAGAMPPCPVLHLSKEDDAKSSASDSASSSSSGTSSSPSIPGIPGSRRTSKARHSPREAILGQESRNSETTTLESSENPGRQAPSSPRTQSAAATKASLMPLRSPLADISTSLSDAQRARIAASRAGALARKQAKDAKTVACDWVQEGVKRRRMELEEQ